MKRIMIIGFSGCGKSTLARQLGEMLDIEPMYFDSIHWLPGWVESSVEYKTERILPVLKRNKWIIEGSYRRILWRERAEGADTIIFLDFNRWLCLYRVIKRRIMYSGKTRPDMGKGCREKLDLEFLKWVVWDARKKRRQLYEFTDFLKKDPNKNVYIFKRPKELERFLKNTESKIMKGMTN